MHFTLATSAAVLLAGLTAAAPAPITRRGFTINLKDGFPSPNADQLALINKQAGGSLSNGGAPKVAPASIPIFQLVAFNEIFEVAFFSSLLQNLTAGQYDHEFKDTPEELKADLTEVLKTILAQEELHAINAVRILEANNAFAPSPCTYKFPTTGLFDGIQLASTFTSFVMGTLQDASQSLSINGDAGPVRAVASTIGQEGEQNGFYRTLLARRPSQKPFLTTSVAPFAFSLLQAFVVDCPFDLAQIPIPRFPLLSVLSGDGGRAVESRTQTLRFAAAGLPAEHHGRCDGLFVTYFTGQDVPSSWPVQACSWDGDALAFEANFPYDELVMDGLTVASLTAGGKFANPAEVVKATLAAPGLIEVNDKLASWM